MLSKNLDEDPGGYVLIMFRLYSWGSLFGVLPGISYKKDFDILEPTARSSTSDLLGCRGLLPETEGTCVLLKWV